MGIGWDSGLSPGVKHARPKSSFGLGPGTSREPSAPTVFWGSSVWSLKSGRPQAKPLTGQIVPSAVRTEPGHLFAALSGRSTVGSAASSLSWDERDAAEHMIVARSDSAEPQTFAEQLVALSKLNDRGIIKRVAVSLDGRGSNKAPVVDAIDRRQDPEGELETHVNLAERAHRVPELPTWWMESAAELVESFLATTHQLEPQRLTVSAKVKRLRHEALVSIRLQQWWKWLVKVSPNPHSEAANETISKHRCADLMLHFVDAVTLTAGRAPHTDESASVAFSGWERLRAWLDDPGVLNISQVEFVMWFDRLIAELARLGILGCGVASALPESGTTASKCVEVDAPSSIVLGSTGPEADAEPMEPTVLVTSLPVRSPTKASSSVAAKGAARPSMLEHYGRAINGHVMQQQRPPSREFDSSKSRQVTDTLRPARPSRRPSSQSEMPRPESAGASVPSRALVAGARNRDLQRWPSAAVDSLQDRQGMHRAGTGLSQTHPPSLARPHSTGHSPRRPPRVSGGFSGAPSSPPGSWQQPDASKAPYVAQMLRCAIKEVASDMELHAEGECRSPSPRPRRPVYTISQMARHRGTEKPKRLHSTVSSPMILSSRAHAPRVFLETSSSAPQWSSGPGAVGGELDFADGQPLSGWGRMENSLSRPDYDAAA